MNMPHEAAKLAARLSRRAEALGTENAFVVLAEVNRLIREGRDIVSFCIGQPDFPTPTHVQDAAVEAIRGGAPATLTDFATGVAYMEFTEAVARSARLGEAVELPLEEFREEGERPA